MILRLFYSVNMHYVDLFPIGVFGKSGTTKIWGGAFAPPAPPLATPLDIIGLLVGSCDNYPMACGMIL